MNTIHHSLRWLPTLSVAFLLFLSSGCQTPPQSDASPAVAAEPSQEPANVMAQSDTERAEAAIERDRQERSGQRRPFDRGHDRVVDQPRVGNR